MRASVAVESYSLRLHKAREQFESILVNAAHLCDEISHISSSSPVKSISPRKVALTDTSVTECTYKTQVSGLKNTSRASVSRSESAVINDKNDKIFALETELELLKEQFNSNKRELELMKDRCQQIYDNGVNSVLLAENNELKKQINQLKKELAYEKDSQAKSARVLLRMKTRKVEASRRNETISHHEQSHSNSLYSTDNMNRTLGYI